MNTLNVVNKKIHELLQISECPPFMISELKREHLHRTGEVLYLDCCFGNLGGEGNVFPHIKDALTNAFGKYKLRETEFKKIDQESLALCLYDDSAIGDGYV